MTKQESGGGRATRARTEDKLEKLLNVAASLMAERGYDQTTIRDVGRETGFSLAGMYYYFKGKEDLLAQIQKRTFASLLEEQEREMEADGAPADRFRRLVRNHLSFFTRHMNELKVCTYELESVKGEQYREIELLRRAYFKLTADVVGGLVGKKGGKEERETSIRHITLFVFGMLNWVFMWYDPEKDDPAGELGDEMVAMVMNGLAGEGR